ncbi:MAG: acyltransferase [Fimbriimonas ginsengisoli]|nr:acyltransferase [Fimbriimonas ginsengisoli]
MRPRLTREESAPRERFTFIEGMRGLAALYVVLGHLCSMSDPEALHRRPTDSPAWLQAVMAPFWHGHLAVAVFIVISGFCLQAALFPGRDGRLRDVRKFLKRRAWRILPPYYACLALSLVVAVTITSTQQGMPFDQVPAVFPLPAPGGGAVSGGPGRIGGGWQRGGGIDPAGRAGRDQAVSVVSGLVRGRNGGSAPGLPAGATWRGEAGGRSCPRGRVRFWGRPGDGARRLAPCGRRSRRPCGCGGALRGSRGAPAWLSSGAFAPVACGARNDVVHALSHAPPDRADRLREPAGGRAGGDRRVPLPARGRPARHSRRLRCALVDVRAPVPEASGSAAGCGAVGGGGRARRGASSGEIGVICERREGDAPSCPAGGHLVQQGSGSSPPTPRPPPSREGEIFSSGCARAFQALACRFSRDAMRGVPCAFAQLFR